MTANQKRENVVKEYRKYIKQKNIYNQSLRQYCTTKYKGNYYSDCSSSVNSAYVNANVGFSNGLGGKLGNTASIYNAYKQTSVDCDIVNGQVKKASTVLRVADVLLFRGSDASRPLAIGHVEIVSKIVGDKVYCVGHGSGNPSEKLLSDYCKARYNMKTTTKYGNRGLCVVLRPIADDKESKQTNKTNKETVNKTTNTITKTVSTSYYKKCDDKYNSIVDALASIGVDISVNNRAKIYLKNFKDAYKGTAIQNINMLELLKKGKLKK